LRRSREYEARQGPTSNTQNRLGSQLLALRWHEGRIGEMEPGYRRAVDIFPRMMTARAALAFIYAETGQRDRAREELERLTERPLDTIPRDFGWWFVMVLMSGAAIATASRDVAHGLLDTLAPYRERNAATAGAVSFGSAALSVARLAAFLERWDVAEDHFEHALAFNVRTRQRTWAAHTRFYFAEMLRARGAAADTPRARELVRIATADAHEIGMAGLAARLAGLADGG
jgi:hypothetical protein